MNVYELLRKFSLLSCPSCAEEFLIANELFSEMKYRNQAISCPLGHKIIHRRWAE